MPGIPNFDVVSGLALCRTECPIRMYTSRSGGRTGSCGTACEGQLPVLDYHVDTGINIDLRGVGGLEEL
jgi:hypothetical protein